jgi:SNF2 family DNA or RNA helicase
MSSAARNAAIDEFKKSDRDGTRVLIVSNVGLVGLNLPVASIVVLVVRVSTELTVTGLTTSQDTLWSAQDERQLFGRVWRHPQKKQVLTYRLIAAGTSDVFLNSMSFDKGAMHDAFTGVIPSIRECSIHPL